MRLRGGAKICAKPAARDAIGQKVYSLLLARRLRLGTLAFVKALQAGRPRRCLGGSPPRKLRRK